VEHEGRVWFQAVPACPRPASKAAQEDRLTQYPTEERGLYHLTPSGWIRQDKPPFPTDRAETWSYQIIYISDDAKERIWLTRIWKDCHLDSGDRKALRGRFGMPVDLQTGRNITLQCDV
jgi:hypothetical protein